MKKYLANVCTALECVCAIIIFMLAVVRDIPEHALYAFIFGQIMDAIDGPLARRFHYPSDGKYRWWREYASVLDQLSDLLLGIATCTYIIFCINRVIGIILLSGASFTGIIVQNIAYDFPPLRINLIQRKPKIGNPIVLIRRWTYVALIALTVALLLWSTSWSSTIKIVSTIILGLFGIVLFFCKINRLTEVKTKL